MLVLNGLALPLDEGQGAALDIGLQKAGLRENDVAEAGIRKVSVDARRRPPKLVYSLAFVLKEAQKEAEYAKQNPALRLAVPAEYSPKPGTQPLPGPVVVCGLGPAGLFAALALAKAGYAPLVLERGADMDERREAVAAFEATGVLDECTNIQFGEGGAGTFSDGKLRTRIGDALCDTVTRWLLDAGAPAEIAWRSHPHIGTDLLRGVFVALRRQLCALGGSVRFNTRLTGLERDGAGRLAAVQTTEGPLPCAALVLACGHSARDTFAAVHKAGAELEAKSFSVGLRIEHLQADIDRGLYHEAAGHPALPPGEYQLSAKCGGRGVYTFCMCPGGSVVAAASENGGVVTNGMSNHARSGPNANAALVAGVDAADFGGDPFEAIAFQRRLEQAAYAAGGGAFAAPAQTVGAFLQGVPGLQKTKVRPSYPRGVAPAELSALLPGGIGAALAEGIAAFGRKLPGFDEPGAVLTGLETRTSAPLRILRGDDCESPSLTGLYPCGEGAGYAGGIMSAAVDGLRVAQSIIERYTAP